jgi:hypothetical protein
MSPRPGLGAPFNFFGRLNQVNLKHIPPPKKKRNFFRKKSKV